MNNIRSREGHIAWCKERALKYCDMGDVNSAFASISSDLKKHPDTENHPAIKLGFQLLLLGSISNPADMRKFIEGFN